VSGTIWPPKPLTSDHYMAHPTDEDKAMAEATLDWIREELASKPELNDYEHNLVVVGKSEYIEPRSLGLAVSAVSAYQRAKEMLARKEATAKQWANSQHVGTIGQRMEFTLTVVTIRNFASDFGVSYQHIMSDGQNQFLWYGSKELEVGKTFKFKATVKNHNEFNGVKQTILTRVMGEKEVA
jgi:hypothetical protein